jgi:hypothetical protein
MHDLTIAAACRVKASTHAQHHITMMMMMKSNDTSDVKREKNDSK